MGNVRAFHLATCEAKEHPHCPTEPSALKSLSVPRRVTPSAGHPPIHSRVHLCSAACHVRLMATAWTVAHQAPLSMGWILQARILERVAIVFSRGSSQTRNQTHFSYVSCVGRWILYHWCDNEITYIHIYRRRQWHPTLVLLPGKSRGWRSLVGCSP